VSLPRPAAPLRPPPSPLNPDARARRQHNSPQNLEKARSAETERHTLQKYLSKQSIYVTAAEMDDTIDIRRRKLEVEALQREEALETLTRTAQVEGRRKAFEQAQETALATELEATRREEESRRREIQRICEADPSLKVLQVRDPPPPHYRAACGVRRAPRAAGLHPPAHTHTHAHSHLTFLPSPSLCSPPPLPSRQSQLQMAYIQRERGEQLVEKEARAEFEKELVRTADAALEASRLKALEVEKERREKERLAGLERKRVLEAQLEERQVREFISAEEEGKREKALVAAILDKIAAEDAAEAVQAARARAEVIRAIEDFKGQRERAVAAALAAEREEHARIAAFIAGQAKREEAAKAAKGADAAEREAKYRALVAAEEARRKAQEEEDQLRWILVDNEADRRRKEEEEKKKAREERMRADFRVANEQQRLCVHCLLAAHARPTPYSLLFAAPATPLTTKFYHASPPPPPPPHPPRAAAASRSARRRRTAPRRRRSSRSSSKSARRTTRRRRWRGASRTRRWRATRRRWRRKRT